MAHHAIGAADIKLLADLADRRSVAAIANFVSDEFVDHVLPLGHDVEFRHGVGILIYKSGLARIRSPYRNIIYECSWSIAFVQFAASFFVFARFAVPIGQ